ncbi:MAG: GGDEF domain-containing protein [Silicimonas sp.]|nr:GGDEF domain-containing protein [Silicimonas sp.]
MRKILGWFAPKKWSDFAWKSALLCACIVIWDVIFTKYLQGEPTSFDEIAIEAIGVGGPFVLLFMLGSWHQVTALRVLTKRAYFDPLSGVFNRHTFISRLNKAIPQASKGILMLIDADHFKQINDQYGHAVGDRCIEAIGHRLNWHVRDGDLAGRVGGEEFAVFLPNVSEEHGRAVAQRLGLPVSFTDAARQTNLTVTLSIGAVWTKPDQSIEQQLVAADEALYVAKSSGRAQLRFSDGGDGIPLSALETPPDPPSEIRCRRSNSKIRIVSQR